MPTVEILLFAGLRERARRDRLAVEVEEGATSADVKRAVAHTAPELAELLPPCRLAAGQEFTAEHDVINLASELALIPPVSGGHDGPGPDAGAAVRLESTPLSLDAVVRAVEHPGAGGLTTFTGNVRAQSRGKEIERLEYEAYGPMAVAVMQQIAREIEGSIDGARVAIHHRVGVLAVGETAVVIAASAPHRDEAFRACRAAIERLKEDVPIWKREVATDGAEWIGQGP